MELRWINFLKGLSIIAVVLDHLYGIIYSSPNAHLLTIFSVTLFVVLSGVTSAISNERSVLTFSDYIKKKFISIFIPYLIATFVYHIYSNNYYFNFDLFFSQIIKFNAADPFYFIFFYLQLIFLSRFLYKLFLNRPVYQQAGLLLIIYLICEYTNNYTQLPYVLGAGKLFGGSYLFAFCVGIVFYINYKSISKITRKWYALTLIFSAAVLVCFIKYDLIQKSWANPPNKYTLFYSLFVAIFFISLFELSRRLWVNKLYLPIEWIGKFSLYTFLYHLLFIRIGISLLSKNYYMFTDKIFLFCIAILPCLLIGIATTYKKKISSILFRN
ncbi:Acyltransferase family protein [compost metagenome]